MSQMKEIINPFYKKTISEPSKSRKIDKPKRGNSLKKLLDVESIEHHIGASVDQVLELKKGYLNKKFLLRSAGSHYVLKIYRDNLSFVSPKLSSEGRAQAEYQALQICQANKLRAPRPVGLFGKAVLMTHIYGKDLTDLPLSKGFISLIVSWLIKFHSIELSSDLLNIGVVNAPLLGASRHLRKYISNNPSYSLAREVEELLIDASHSFSFPNSMVLLCGDPTIDNWIIKEKQIYGLDFEFFSPGNSIFEIGLLLASILDYSKFTEAAYELSEYALRQYLMYNSSISLMDIRLGILCGLILIATNVPNPERCHRIFNYTRKTLMWIKNIRGIA